MPLLKTFEGFYLSTTFLYQKPINTGFMYYRYCQSRLSSQDDSTWSFGLRFSLYGHHPFSPDCAFMATSPWGSKTTRDGSRTRGRLSRHQASYYCFWSTVFGVLGWLVLLFGLSIQHLSFQNYKSFENVTFILKGKYIKGFHVEIIKDENKFKKFVLSRTPHKKDEKRELTALYLLMNAIQMRLRVMSMVFFVLCSHRWRWWHFQWYPKSCRIWNSVSLRWRQTWFARFRFWM